MGLSKKLSNGLNLAAAAVALYAALFYWTRGWIGFTPQSLPWLLYTLLPYITFWLLSKKLQTQGVSKSRNILFIIAEMKPYIFGQLFCQMQPLNVKSYFI